MENTLRLFCVSVYIMDSKGEGSWIIGEADSRGIAIAGPEMEPYVRCPRKGARKKGDSDLRKARAITVIGS